MTNSGGNQNGERRSVTTPNASASTVSDHQQNNRPVRHQSQYTFHRATKQDAKLRLALAGPSGSGKTYTLLKLATELGGRIAVVDTERGSAEKYADLFEFDTLPLASFSPDLIPELIDAAAEQGYNVLIIDSLSHFWNGIDGELDQVDKAAKRMQNPNSFAAWKTVTPKHNALVDAMLAAPLHVLVSMRTKTEWVLEKDEKSGKTAPRKIGLAPVMRDGIEYEFDVFGDMNQEHDLIISKSRCSALADGVFNKPGVEVATILKGWLTSPLTTPDQKRVAELRIAELKTAAAPKPPAAAELPARADEIKRAFLDLRERIGETRYYQEMDAANVSDPAQLRPSAARELYRRLRDIAQKEVA